KSTVALALCAGALALTHYWTLYLLLTVGIWLILVAAWPQLVDRRHQRRPEVTVDGQVDANVDEVLADTSKAAGRSVWWWGSRGPLYGLVGVVGGGVVFAPWLGGFFYQLANTGTPWGEPASFAAITHAYGQWAGGPTTQGRVLLFIVTALVAFGIAGRAVDGRFVMLDLRGHEPGRT
nr:hypothetical protein [Micromonospora sp. DSM 115978]